MAVSKTQKTEILDELISKITDAKSIGFVMTEGLTVENFSELRKELRTVWTSYTLAKKTLMAIAVKKVLNIDIDLKDLTGQIWMICSNDDMIAWLSKVNAFIPKVKKGKKDRMFWIASIFEWEFKGKEETMKIATMPSREVLLAKLLGSMMSPLSSLARFFDWASKKIMEESKATVWELEWKKEVE